MIAATPKPPYYAVIFTSMKDDAGEDYELVASQMMTLAREQEGFLGVESVGNNFGITVSYWQNLESIRQWREQADHQLAQKFGREKWYSAYKTRIALVEWDYGFER